VAQSSFVPEDPDTSVLRQFVRSATERTSLAVLYFEKHYPLASKLDSVKYLEGSENEMCFFIKKYALGTAYKLDACAEEGGGGEVLYFPKMKTQEARKFVEKLFFDPENTWQNELNYAPGGAGCYYEIIQTKTQTIIDTYCGC
jgi:hypothetical protein